MPKVDKLLATLRGEAAPEPEPEPDAPAPAASVPAPEFEALKGKLAELEEKLGALAAGPPPMDAPPAEAPEEVPPLAPPEPAPEPPKPPTELTLFLHTRVELLEKRLELASQEALRSSLLLREREEAQRKAQAEVEDLFRNIREQQRAANFDKTLRERWSSAAARVKELEGRLALAQLRMVPAEEVLRFVETEEGRAELKRRLEAQVAGATEPPAPPRTETVAPSPQQAPPAAGDSRELDSLAVVLGRVADLERRLEEAHRDRDKERFERKRWEEGILEALSSSRGRWEKSGGPELLVEAALEGVVESVRERDTLQLEMGRLVELIKEEPPGSEKLPELRGKLALAHKRMDALAAELSKQTALVQAWVKRNTEGGA